MEGQRIDELARRIGSGTSRRTVLKRIAAGIGANVFGLGRTSGAGATALPPCNPDNTCNQTGAVCTLDGVCDPNAECGRIVGCPTGYLCYNSVCVFPCVETGGVCAGDDDCCDELVCTNGACAESDVCVGSGGPCETDDDCCTGICAQGACSDTDACAPENEACTFPEVTPAASLDGSNCCAGYCLDGVCVPACIGHGGDCHDDEECCAGLACFDGRCDNPSGFCGVPGDACEAPDHHCCAGLTCFEAQCDRPSGLCMDVGQYCDKAFACCDGLICGADSFCHAAKKVEQPTSPDGGLTVTTLPSTGSGGDGSEPWMTTAALGAAAVIGGALLRKAQPREDTEHT